MCINPFNFSPDGCASRVVYIYIYKRGGRGPFKILFPFPIAVTPHFRSPIYILASSEFFKSFPIYVYFSREIPSDGEGNGSRNSGECETWSNPVFRAAGKRQRESACSINYMRIPCGNEELNIVDINCAPTFAGSRSNYTCECLFILDTRK